LSKQDAKQLRLDIVIGLELYRLISEKLELLEESPEISIRNIPIAIVDVIEAVKKLR